MTTTNQTTAINDEAARVTNALRHFNLAAPEVQAAIFESVLIATIVNRHIDKFIGDRSITRTQAEAETDRFINTPACDEVFDHVDGHVANVIDTFSVLADLAEGPA